MWFFPAFFTVRMPPKNQTKSDKIGHFFSGLHETRNHLQENTNRLCLRPPYPYNPNPIPQYLDGFLASRPTIDQDANEWPNRYKTTPATARVALRALKCPSFSFQQIAILQKCPSRLWTPSFILAMATASICRTRSRDTPISLPHSSKVKQIGRAHV